MTLLLGIAPISELRGALPYAYYHGLPLSTAAFLAIGVNLFVFPLLTLFLNFFHHIFYKRLTWYAHIFDRWVLSTRNKMEDKIKRFGYIGLTLFVAVPLPITGAYTGTLGAWLFGLEKKRSFLAISIGILISATIVSLVLLAGEGTYSIFIKHIG